MNADDLRAGFQRLLDAEAPERGGSVEGARVLSGGYSRVSCAADVRWADGTNESFLLRADPVAGDGVFMSDRDDEWDLLVALAAARSRTVSIPAPRWYDGDGRHFGTKCMVIEFRPGTPMHAIVQDPALIDQMTEVFVDQIARVHGTPLDVLPASMARPADWSSYIDDAIELIGRNERGLLDANPVMRYVPVWLDAHRPEPLPLTLVHGDPQPGNVLIAAGHDPLVIDWEFAHVGDPREDLGYYIQIPMTPNLYRHGPETFLERYRAATGFSESAVNQQTVQYFLLLAMGRLLGQMAQAADRLARGGVGGAMATYLINALSHQSSMYLDVCRSAS